MLFRQYMDRDPVIDTHMHADHISSARELAEAAGAEYVLFSGTEETFVFRGVAEDEVLRMGNPGWCAVVDSAGTRVRRSASSAGTTGRSPLRTKRGSFSSCLRRSPFHRSTQRESGPPTLG
jgi:hypothetical protein